MAWAGDGDGTSVISGQRGPACQAWTEDFVPCEAYARPSLTILPNINQRHVPSQPMHPTSSLSLQTEPPPLPARRCVRRHGAHTLHPYTRPGGDAGRRAAACLVAALVSCAIPKDSCQDGQPAFRGPALDCCPARQLSSGWRSTRRSLPSGEEHPRPSPHSSAPLQRTAEPASRAHNATHATSVHSLPLAHRPTAKPCCTCTPRECLLLH